MRGFACNARYAVRKAGYITLLTYGMSLGFIVYFRILGLAEYFSASDMFIKYLRFSVYMGITYIIIFTAIHMGTDFYQQLSCGSTRNCAAIGMVLIAAMTSLMQFAINTVLSLAAAVILPEIAVEPQSLLQMLISFLLAIGIGTIAGVITFLFGKIGYVISVFVGCFSIGLLFAGEYNVENVNDELLYFFLLKRIMGTAVDMNLVYGILLFAEVVLIVVSGALLVYVTRRAEVRV